MKKFGDIVILRDRRYVIVAVHKRRKWTYFDLVAENPEYHSSDFLEDLVEFEQYREDKLV